MKRSQFKKNVKRHTPIFFPIVVLFLLLTGIVLSLIQLQTQQDFRQQAATPLDCTVAEQYLASSSAEQQMFSEINAYRQQQGLQPLAWSSLLKKSAAFMSNDMLSHVSLNHVDSLGRNFPVRIADCGYTTPAAFGENIDNGTASVSALLSSWKHSLPHNDNLLSAAFTEIGISLATGSAVTDAYWTVNFAGPAASPSATIPISATPSASISPSVFPSISSTPSGTISPSVVATKVPSTSTVVTNRPTQPFPPTGIPTATKIPSPTLFPGYVPNPLDTQLLVSAKIPSLGNGGNKNPRTKMRKIDVIIFDSENKQVMRKSGDINFDGNLFKGVIHLGTIPNGTYYIKVITPYSLQALVQPQFQVLRNDRLNTLPQVTFIQGDLNNNNFLNLQDYNMALNCFQNKNCVARTAIDLNDDGKANITDYNLLLQNFWEYSGD